MPWAAVAQAGTGLASGIIASKSAEAAREAYMNQITASVNDLMAIGIPGPEARQIVFERYRSAGDYNPLLEEVLSKDDTEYNKISVDPRYKEAQLKALSSLGQIGDEGGLLLEDKANLEKILGDLGAEERGRRERILQDSQERGGYSNNATLMAQLMNAQNSSQQAHASGLNIAAQAQKRALDAIAQAGRLGGDVREQEFGEQASKAKAQDVINSWNTENRQRVMGSNVGSLNDANKYNLQNRQTLMNANTDLTNKERVTNRDSYLDYYKDQMDRAKAIASARTGVALAYKDQGNNEAEKWAGIGRGVSGAIQGYSDYSDRKADIDRQDERWQDEKKLRSEGKWS
jgi:hypothetical protein